MISQILIFFIYLLKVEIDFLIIVQHMYLYMSAQAPLWTHAQPICPYEHLREIETKSIDLEIDDRNDVYHRKNNAVKFWNKPRKLWAPTWHGWAGSNKKNPTN